MDFKINKKDVLLIGVTFIFLLVVAGVGWWVVGRDVLFFLPIVAILPLMALILAVYRRLSAQLRMLENLHHQDYRQLEALFSIYQILKPGFPLPDMRRDYATAPDFLKKLSALILSEKPTLVVEASCGVSTVIIAYCLQKNGVGKVISLEHDAHYAAITRRNLALHGLEHIATVLHAPLKEIAIKGKSWLWYDVERFSMQQPIDLLVIDGPPGDLQKLSRYPALPVLEKHLNGNATILLDDGKRKDEQEIAALWQKEFSWLNSEYLDFEHGAFLIRKTNP